MSSNLIYIYIYIYKIGYKAHDKEAKGNSKFGRTHNHFNMKIICYKNY